MKFNGNDATCINQDCKACYGKVHIFCELYKTGLLGYIDAAKTGGKYVQKFANVGDCIFAKVGLLPESTHYLIHPILDELIRERNSHYKEHISKFNIVGYDRPWNIHQLIPDENIDRPELFISSTLDLQLYRDIIEKHVLSQGFRVTRSEQLNSADSIKLCKEKSIRCEYFVAIFGPRYGEEIENLSICEHEFNAARENNPDKILVYVLDGNILEWDKRQQDFVNRVQNAKGMSYMRGGRVNQNNIERRFHKDLLEKIKKLSKQPIS
jgi:hypothetical protein